MNNGRLYYMRDNFQPSMSDEEISFLFHPYNLIGLVPAALDILLGSKEGISIGLPFSWVFPESIGRAIPYNMQSFRYQYCLVLEYERSGQIEYLNQFIDWIFDWIHAHPSIDRTDKWAWHDDATAKRAFYFSVALVCYEKLLSEDQITELRRSLRMHAQLLSREDFYTFGHNHGMYQDMALAMYAVCCDEDTDYYLRLSAARSLGYFERCYNNEGVHKEHSPQYHTGMARSLKWFYCVYRDKDPIYANELEVFLDNAQSYTIWLTMPDGTLPSIGDSPKAHKDLSNIWKRPEYIYCATCGQKGRTPKGCMQVFPNSGYGIFRNNWSLHGQGTWMMLLAATHGEAHKHNDDLSFILYHGGGELISEAGNRNYNYSDPLTEYCYSSYGHNVLFVNGKGWDMKPTHLPLIEETAYETSIVDWVDKPEFSSVTGRQVRFPGIIQERTLMYDRRNEVITVEDRITSENPVSFRLIYHLAPAVTAELLSERRWCLLRNGTEIARIRIEGNMPDLMADVLTENQLPWRTEVFWGKQEPLQGKLLTVDWKEDIHCALSLIRLRIELL